MRMSRIRAMQPDGFQFFGHGHQHVSHDAMTFGDAKASFTRCFDTMRSLGRSRSPMRIPWAPAIGRRRVRRSRNPAS